ncbi:MAG: hypothetical protein V4538_15575 [Bacteroidota bacterium]
MSLKQIYNKLKPVVALIDKSVTCQTLVTNTDGTFTFTSNYTNYAVAGYTITIGLSDYLITNVECNETITVSGAGLPTQLTFDLYPIFFKHGSIKVVAGELNKTPHFTNKLPLIFLHEVADESLHFDSLDSINIDADCRLYFLTPCDFKNWDQESTDTLATQPMRNLAKEFVKVVADNQYIAQLTGTGSVKNYSKFGAYTDNGVAKNYFNESLSGVGLKITIPFLKTCECCGISDLDTRPAPGYVYDMLGNVLAVLYSNQTYTTGTPCAPVTIQNIETLVTITTVNSGGTYQVEQLTHITDTITNNTVTIIDPII